MKFYNYNHNQTTKELPLAVTIVAKLYNCNHSLTTKNSVVKNTVANHITYQLPNTP